MLRYRFCAALILILVYGHGARAQAPQLQHTPAPSPTGAKVFFKDVTDGATVPSRLILHFGVSGMEVVPAKVLKRNSGHHHLLIDSPLPPLNAPIPNDANHLHFGRGQEEAEIILPEGEHTLQLLFGDQDHFPHVPPVASEVVHVKVDPATVEKPREAAPPGASVFFVGLEDGATIPTRSVVRFGVNGIDLAPASAKKPNTAHHHLIIDAPLPPLDREIPNDPNHLHFGRGQTETELTLAPGAHTLQLLLGDYEHVPHDPPIASQILHVTAVESGTSPSRQPAEGVESRTPSPPDAKVYFVYPSNGALIYPRSTIRFGLKNMGVAPAGVVKANTGHHHLLVDTETPPLDKKIPNDFNHLHFGAGQTEKKIELKPGKHTLQLILGDHDHFPHDPPVVSERIEVTVAPHKKLQRRHRQLSHGRS